MLNLQIEMSKNGGKKINEYYQKDDAFNYYKMIKLNVIKF